jgi:hypothetical protein
LNFRRVGEASRSSEAARWTAVALAATPGAGVSAFELRGGNLEVGDRLVVVALGCCDRRVAERAKVAPWQAGVYWAPEVKADLFAFTLDKTSGQFSPTTRYRDYAISRELIHWESQSATRADSATGRRYQTHEALGSSVMLFARLRADDRAFWFLGPATYVSRESEQPMAITWRLRHPLPGDLFAQFAAAVA